MLPRTLAVGAALFGFLLAGNRIAIMPFMGWVDILPAVLTWVPGTAAAAAVIRRRPLAGVVAGLATLELATVAGSLHAALSLRAGLGTAAGWFPLALLPGGSVTFGPVYPGGVHASELLLGNASAMAGPMALATAYVLALARELPGLSVRRRRLDLSVPLGVAAAVGALVVAEVIRRVPDGSLGVTLHRLIDNSSIFGFGFLAYTPGRIVLALVAGLLAAQLGVARRV